jgi:hypothetical protein
MLAMLLAVAMGAIVSVPAAASTPTTPAIGAAPPVLALSLAQDRKQIDINVRSGGRWYASPIWIAIGVLAVIVLLLVIVMAARGGGGTTVVKD